MAGSGPLSPHTLNGSRRRAHSGMLDALASDLQLCQPHACTAFSQLALFVHYDPTKFSEGTVLSHALKLVSPTLELVDCRDLLQHLWNTHAKHSNRGSLYYKYLTSFQLRQQTCSVCESHAAAAQCPVILQVAALLAILHHGHGQQRLVDEDGGGRGGKAECQTAAVHHVEWREGPGQREKEEKDWGRPRAQSIKEESTPGSKTLLQVLTKLVLRREYSLQCLAMETEFYVLLSAG